MNTRLFLLPTLCLAGAAVLLAPAPGSEAFTLLGSNLSVNERDVRMYDNFSDATANDNTTPASQFPGQTGAELALWKGIVEWGSQAHGNGTGDSSQPVLGSGGANFDAFWAGAATAPGTSSQNVVSKINTCPSGVLAYCEAPFSSGWRIRVCDSWVWNDGPGSIGPGQYDLQGVLTHEYGHALGLGHSAASGATMYPSVGSGVTGTRSIEADDISGVKAIYGVRSASKPVIIATVAAAGTLTIHGSGFTATNNQVWFRSNAATLPSIAEPRVLLTGIASDGVKIIVPIPSSAGPGDVIVRAGLPGHSSVSNAFPTDLVGTFGTPPIVIQPALTAVEPAQIESLIPGTARSVTLAGTNLDLVRNVRLDGQAIDAARWELLDVTALALDMPQTSTLGRHVLAIDDGSASSELEIEVVPPAAPRLELGTGEPANVVQRTAGLGFRLGGRPGSRQLVLVSSSATPSQSALASLGIGAGFTDLVSAGAFVVPAAGWVELRAASLPATVASGQLWYAQSVELGGGAPFPSSNLQSILLVP